MDLIDDVDLLSTSLRQIAHRITQISDIIDRIIARTVNLNDIWTGARKDLCAVTAIPTWLRCRPLLAVQRSRENSCRSSLSDSPRTREQETMMHSTETDRVLQGLCDMTLSRDFFEAGRSPLSGDGLVTH
jgi:hypothetical protein